MDADDTLIDQLQHISDYTNLVQLEILQKEINYIQMSAMEPSPQWYEERIDKIYEYNTLNWDEMQVLFRDKDEYLRNGSAYVRRMLDYLIYQWTSNEMFELKAYKELIDYIYHIWKHYETWYIGGNTDPDMVDLVENMMRL